MASKKRYLYLSIGTVAMTIYGLMYCWTVFSPFVQLGLGIHASRVANVFSFCQISFCLGGLFGGFTYYKFDYRKSMLCASILIFLGLFLASKANSIYMIILGFSFMYNFMAGFAYKSVLTAVLSWFKDKPGLASGIIVMGAGLTAFLLNSPLAKIIEASSWNNAMFFLACIAGFLSLLNALIIKPFNKSKVNKGAMQSGEQVSTKDMLKDSRFYVYFIWSVLLLAGCSSISGTAVSCSLSFGLIPTIAAQTTMIISLSNSLSRVFYGIFYDKFGRKVAMAIATSSFVLAVISLYTAFYFKEVKILLMAFLFFGISFGGIPTISSTYILVTFGSENYPSNFSIQGLYSLFSSILGTMLYSRILYNTNNQVLSYSYLIVYACVVIILFFLLNLLLNKKRKSK